MRCYRKILHTSYKDHVTNEEFRAKIQQAIAPLEELLTIVKRRKLQWHGHVSRSSGLTKTILRGTVKGGRRQGGQRKRWEGNIREWTGLEFGKSSRLRDWRWWWWWWWWWWWCVSVLQVGDITCSFNSSMCSFRQGCVSVGAPSWEQQAGKYITRHHIQRSDPSKVDTVKSLSRITSMSQVCVSYRNGTGSACVCVCVCARMCGCMWACKHMRVHV